MEPKRVKPKRRRLCGPYKTRLRSSPLPNHPEWSLVWYPLRRDSKASAPLQLLIDTEDFPRLSTIRGGWGNFPLLHTDTAVKLRQSRRSLGKIILGLTGDKGKEVEFRNGNSLDFRKQNLKVITVADRVKTKGRIRLRRPKDKPDYLIHHYYQKRARRDEWQLIIGWTDPYGGFHSYRLLNADSIESLRPIRDDLVVAMNREPLRSPQELLGDWLLKKELPHDVRIHFYSARPRVRNRRRSALLLEPGGV